MSPVPISQVVEINISRENVTVPADGFGIPMILGPNGVFLSRTRSYLGLTDVAEDFTITDPEYLAAQSIFSQNPRPRTIKIAKRDPAVAKVDKLTFNVDFVALNSIAYSINGVAQTPVVFSVDHATTLAALAAAIQAHALIATATVTGVREITATAQTAGIPFTISGVLVTLGATQPIGTVTNFTPNHGIVEDITLAAQEDNVWYRLIETEHVQAEVELLAAWVQANKKLFGTVSNNADILNAVVTTDIASVLNAQNYDRTFPCYNGITDDFMEAAWHGRMAPLNPGSATYKFKNLIGITADNLTPSERSAALAKNCNLYSTIGSQDVTEEGVVASGEYIDVIEGNDWVETTMQNEIFRLLATQPKVPYTDGGVAQIESVIRSVLRQAVSRNIYASFEIFVPKVADILPNDKANRFLPDITWTATLTGAVHRLVVNGTVSV
ncbi:MAG TPA: DUF3383 family protein [bacterium]|nr:DUF3383 family protein [bacterium]